MYRLLLFSVKHEVQPLVRCGLISALCCQERAPVNRASSRVITAAALRLQGNVTDTTTVTTNRMRATAVRLILSPLRNVVCLF